MRLLGIIKALAKNLIGELNYLLPRESQYKPVVECYPDKISGRTPADMFPRMRGFLVNDLSKCTGCGECIGLCAVNALSMETSSRVDGSLEVKTFKIDLGRCYGCSICVDVCPVGSITHTTEYEGAQRTREEMVTEFLPADMRTKVSQQKMRTYEFRWK